MSAVDCQQIGACTLYLGDCRDILPMLGPVDVLVTDPPYGVLDVEDSARRARDRRRGDHHRLRKEGYGQYRDTYTNFCTQIVPGLTQALQLVTRAAVFTGPHIQEQVKAAALGGIYCPAGVGRGPWGFKTFLPILLYGKAPRQQFGCRPLTLASSASAEVTGHPTTKPLVWMQWLVQLVSVPGETVLDPYMGSGTTGIACLQGGRTFIGIEVDPTYFRIACRRLAHAAAQPLLFPVAATTPVQESLL